MTEIESTTAEDNQETDPAATDQQTDDTNVDNLDKASESTDTSADDDTKSTTDSTEDAPAPKFDTDIDEWAEKTGRAKPESDRERELYQEVRNGQREYSRTKQAKDSQKEVDSAIKDAKPADNKQDDDEYDDRDPLEKRQEELENRLAESESLRARESFFNEKSVTAEESKVMGEILKEKVDKGGKTAFDYWTNSDQLDDWHSLAKARLMENTDTSVIEEEAARKERVRIAKEFQAGGPARNATVTAPQGAKGYDRAAFLKSDD